MKTIACLVAVHVLSDAVTHAQNGPVSTKDNFVLHFPQNADMKGLTVETGVSGTFGGFFSQAKVVDFKCVIDLNGVYSFRAIIFSQHYQTVLFRLADWREKSAKIDLKPLPSVRLSGKVALPDGLDASRFSIEVSYIADWGMDFLGYIDGMPPGLDIASVDLTKDGAFETMVPDYAHDPVVASQPHKGSLWLLLTEKKTGNHPYDLKFLGGSDAGMVKIAVQYEVLNLRATKR